MPPPTRTPIGLQLANTAKAVSSAFDEALAEAGGSRPMWLILIALKTHPSANQREIADAVGIQGATATHHLNGMERAGLLSRRRDPDNRRTHVVELTDDGEAMFHRLRSAATKFDRRLRTGFTDKDIDRLAAMLQGLQANVAG